MWDRSFIKESLIVSRRRTTYGSFCKNLITIKWITEKFAKVYFFDEPTANLDIKRELNILNVIRKKAKEGLVSSLSFTI
ncbi:MAG: hypothetical protein CM15mP106_8180 [Candidatus Neomarinimicrobiota bacterium]|nr:MAG: hypothetical protein CM15mP106_8180 [Candidatus Neomarinimicrobiota bacterium]